MDAYVDILTVLRLGGVGGLLTLCHRPYVSSRLLSRHALRFGLVRHASVLMFSRILNLIGSVNFTIPTLLSTDRKDP